MMKLGDIVRDRITRFKGVVIAEHRWLNGCRRLSVQSQELKDGKPVDPVCIDEPQLELVKAGQVQELRATGGPHVEPVRQEAPRR